MEAILLDRDVLAVSGPDATTYLQGQVSQDLEAVGPGQSVWSFVLAPQGKVDGWFRATSTEHGWILDTDAGSGEPLLARLERFKLRVDCQIETRPWSMLRLIGTFDAPEPTDGVVVAFDWPGLSGHDLLGANPELPQGALVIDESAYQQRRLAAGLPTLGVDIEFGAMPASSGQIGRSVSFTKGCYTGQELVARVESRGGRSPYRLVRFRSAGQVAPGTELVDDKGPVGTVTSVAADTGGRGCLGIASVARRADVDQLVAVGPEAGAGSVELMPLEGTEG